MTNERAQTELPSLKGCPFCGDDKSPTLMFVNSIAYVGCECGVNGADFAETDDGETFVEKAIAAWNTRTPSPETPVSATPSADVSSLIEVVARALCADQSRRHYGIESNWDEQTDYHRNEWLAEARAAIAANNTEAAIVLKRYREALEQARPIIENEMHVLIDSFTNLSGPDKGEVTDEVGRAEIRRMDDALALINAALKQELE